MAKTIKTHGTWMGGMRVDAQARDHTVIIDQPQGMGGKDDGPNPMEIQLFALAGCLGTVAAIIAMQERIDLKSFEVDIEGDFEANYLLGKTTEGRAGFTAIRVVVNMEVEGMSDEEKQDFLDRVDARCPITDNLVNDTDVVFSLK